MEMLGVTQIILDSDKYRGLFEPNSKLDWIPQETYNLVLNGVDFFHSAACFPYFRMLVVDDNRYKLLTALYNHIVHTLKPDLDKDVAYYTNLPEDDLTEDQWELNTDVQQAWVVDDYNELMQVHKSLKELEDNLLEAIVRENQVKYNEYDHLKGVMNTDLTEHIKELDFLCKKYGMFKDWFDNKFCKYTQPVDADDLRLLTKSIYEFVKDNY